MTDLATRITEGEGSGRIEYKRSCLWPQENDEVRIHSVLMRLANANPDVCGLIELGREDSRQRVGLVDKDLQPVTERQLKGAEQTLVQLAARLDPPMFIRWEQHAQDGVTTIIVTVPGRPRGGWYQSPSGVTKTGSASHPVVAKQQLLQQWAREASEHDNGASGAADMEGLLESVIEETATTLPPSNEFSYLYIVMSPQVTDRSRFERVLSSRSEALAMLGSLAAVTSVPSPRGYSPNLSEGTSWAARNEAWVWETHPGRPVSHPDRFIEMIVNHDGTASLVCGRAGQRAATPVGFEISPGDVRLIPDLIAGLTASLLALCGTIYTQVGYQDIVTIGLTVTGSNGKVWGHALDPEADPPNFFNFGPLDRTRDYRRIMQVAAGRIVTDYQSVTKDLVMTLIGPITPRSYDPFS